MPCCGRPNNRAKKEGASSYYKRYAYLSGPQREAAQKIVGKISKCLSCDALTMGDPCTVCGDPKAKEEK